MALPNLPKFEMIIDPSVTSDVEVQRVAFVDKPAIEKNFLAFKDMTASLNFATDTAKHIVSGPAMIPDMLIYRRDEMGEYNVFFSKETISQIALKFFKKDYHKNLNLFHDPTLTLDNVTIFESFQSDASRGIAPMKGYEDLPDGTWFISAKIEDPKIWNLVTSGAIKGFSVEGIFSYVKKQAASAQSVEDILNRTLSEIRLISVDKPEIMASIKEMFATFKQKFIDTPAVPPVVPPAAAAPAAPAASQPHAKDYTLKDGTTMVNITDLKVGGMATTAGAPCAPGDYELQDGTKITVGDGGLITAVTPAGSGAPPQFASAKDFADMKTTYETKFAAFEKNQVEFTATLKKVNETIVGMAAIVEKLAELPTAAPAAAPGTFSGQEPKPGEEKLQSLVSAFKKLKAS